MCRVLARICTVFACLHVCLFVCVFVLVGLRVDRLTEGESVCVSVPSASCMIRFSIAPCMCATVHCEGPCPVQRDEACISWLCSYAGLRAGNWFGVEGAEFLAPALAGLTQLTSLDLGCAFRSSWILFRDDIVSFEWHGCVCILPPFCVFLAPFASCLHACLPLLPPVLCVDGLSLCVSVVCE